MSDNALPVHIQPIHAQIPGGYDRPYRFKVIGDSCHDLSNSPNVLHRQFTLSEPDKLWADHITCIAPDAGWLFWQW